MPLICCYNLRDQLGIINWFLKQVENCLKNDIMAGLKTGPYGPPSPYVLNVNCRSAYVVFRLAGVINHIIFVFHVFKIF
jgi:hypothetical protein